MLLHEIVFSAFISLYEGDVNTVKLHLGSHLLLGIQYPLLWGEVLCLFKNLYVEIVSVT